MKCTFQYTQKENFIYYENINKKGKCMKIKNNNAIRQKMYNIIKTHLNM